MRNKTLLFLFFLVSQIILSQEITGVVKDALTHKPLDGVSVYFDGTTIGAITNSQGVFYLDNEVETQATLVISYLGYETQYFTSSQIKNLKTIYLNEKVEALDAVVLEVDPWTRKKKMNIFKREFLGNEESASMCKILNEKDIKLIYQPSNKKLLAFCDVPIRIINNYLGYEIQYNMVDFEVQFKESLNGFRTVNSVYNSGTSIFYELKDKPKKKCLKNREIEYLGSSLQFMRALKNKQLTEKKFDIFIQDTSEETKMFFQVNPYAYFKIEEVEENQTKVEMVVPKIVVQYNKADQSTLIMEKGYNTFYIDTYGIHQPSDKLFFSGVFGFKRIASLLPLNYSLDK